MKLSELKPGVRVITPSYGLYYVTGDEQVKPKTVQGVKFYFVNVRPVGANYTFNLMLTEQEIAQWQVHQPLDLDHV